AALTAGPLGANGQGGTVKLSTGSDAAAINPDLVINGTLDVSGKGNSSGGEADLSAAGLGRVLVTGNIVADSGNGTSSDQPLTGGRISLSAAGNVVFVSGNLSASATGAGSGGIIEVKANSLTQLTVGSAATSATGGVKGTITAAGAGAGGAGGSIHIEHGTTGSGTLTSLA